MNNTWDLSGRHRAEDASEVLAGPPDDGGECWRGRLRQLVARVPRLIAAWILQIDGFINPWLGEKFTWFIYSTYMSQLINIFSLFMLPTKRIQDHRKFADTRKIEKTFFLHLTSTMHQQKCFKTTHGERIWWSKYYASRAAHNGPNTRPKCQIVLPLSTAITSSDGDGHPGSNRPLVLAFVTYRAIRRALRAEVSHERRKSILERGRSAGHVLADEVLCDRVRGEGASVRLCRGAVWRRRLVRDGTH